MEGGEERGDGVLLCSRWTRVIITMAARWLCHQDKKIQFSSCKNVDSLSTFTAAQICLTAHSSYFTLYKPTRSRYMYGTVFPEGIFESEHRLREEQECSWMTEMLREAFKSGLPCLTRTVLTNTVIIYQACRKQQKKKTEKEEEKKNHIQSSSKVVKRVLCI